MVEKKGNRFRISRMSRRLRIVFKGLVYFLPVVPVLYWLLYNSLPAVMQEGAFGVGAPLFLEVNSRVFGFAAGLPALVVSIIALNSLSALFSLYERGMYFMAENVKRFRFLGELAMWSILADIFNKTVLIVAQTINNPPGERVLSIGFTSDHVKLLLVAGIVMIIGMVMDEGRKINDENELTV